VDAGPEPAAADPLAVVRADIAALTAKVDQLIERLDTRERPPTVEEVRDRVRESHALALEAHRRTLEGTRPARRPERDQRQAEAGLATPGGRRPATEHTEPVGGVAHPITRENGGK
jgi:hypothetical protein